VFLKFLKSRKYSQLRVRIRGYALSRRNGGFESVRNLKNNLVSIRVFKSEFMVNWFFSHSIPDAELVVRQFIFDRYGGVKLTNAIFECIGSRKPIKMGMPASWRSHLIENDLPVNHFFSKIDWWVTLTFRFIRGIIEIGRLCSKQIRINTIKFQFKKYVYLDGMSPSNLPSHNGGESRYDFCSWYAQWPDKVIGVHAITHDVKGASPCNIYSFDIYYVPPPYDYPMGWRGVLKFSIWGLFAVFWAGLNMLIGRWYLALMLGEAARASAVRQVKSNILAAEYLFHASRSIYRPLWTYEVEKKGAEVALFFYSTMAQPRLISGPVTQKFEWGPNTWPKFMVWDDYQEALLRRDLGDSFAIQKVGPIFFSDIGEALPEIPTNAIAVFDIQPHRISSHLGFSTLADCQADFPDYFHRFLRDVSEVLLENGVTMVLKTKREIGSRGNKSYGQILKGLENQNDVLCIKSGIAARRLAEVCKASISAPFTSTAIFAQQIGHPSIYYDPVGWMQRGDEAAHGIPVLSGKNELRAWIKGLQTDLQAF
jgi:polysaccharide biosynthesis PFTS motif protein